MKRYLLFAGEAYYPSGGWSDYEGSFDTVEEAILKQEQLKNRGQPWYHIVDIETEKVIYEEYT